MTSGSSERDKAIEALQDLCGKDNRPDIRLSAARSILDFVPDPEDNEQLSQLDQLARVWEEGYTSGHSNAMRQMSDEPEAPKTANPYISD